MKKIIKSFADSLSYRPEFPERTSKKVYDSWDTVFQTWTNREAMARSIRMQEMGDTKNKWIAIQPLSDADLSRKN